MDDGEKSKGKADSAIKLAGFAMENAGDAILWISPDSRIINCNLAASRMFGYTKQELLQLSILDIDPHYTPENWTDHFAELRKKSVLDSFETENRTKDGRMIHAEVTASHIQMEDQEFSCAIIRNTDARKVIENTLLFISERSWAKPGGDFFTTMAQYLGKTLSVDYVFINRVSKDGKHAFSLANCRLGKLEPNFEYLMADTPCENVYAKRLCTYPSHIQEKFPQDLALVELRAESYIGIPLWDSLGDPVGLIVLLHRQPIQDIEKIESLLKLVAPHTGPEIERMEAEQKLRESEEKYRNIFENIQDVYYQTDLEGNVLEISPSIKHFSEFDRDDLLNNPIHTVYDDPLDRDKFLKALRKTGVLKDYELRLKTKNGDIRYASINARLIFDEDQKPNRVSGSIRDITDRKKIEEALKESEYFFKESQKAAFIGSYKTDFLGGQWESSEVLDQIFGIDKNFDRSIAGWLDIVHPDDQDMMSSYLSEEVIAKRKPFHKEYRIIRKNDMQVKWVLGQGIVSFNEDGKALSLIGTIRDITERKLDEDKINKLNFAVEASSEVIFMTDMEGIITYMNPAFTTVYGHKAEDVVGKLTPRILKSGVMDDSAYKYFWDQILNKQVITGELINKTKDGRNITIEGSSNAIINKEGTIIGFISIQKDITARKQIEDELVKAKEKAEESDRLKSAFLSNMSHEIRTPMNGILGFAALLKEPNLTTDELQEYIGTIQISGERMLSTINSIVDVSKIESGLIELNVSETNINEKIDFLFRFFKPEAENKGLKLFFQKGLPSEEVFVRTDGEKVYGVLTNLVKNAIKFTHKGSIDFGYEKKDEFLEFFVKDTGIGIIGEQRELIFERFRQGSESINQGYEGSGLGLSICKSYVEMIGGKIWIESNENQGSIFKFTIPYKLASEDKSEIMDLFANEQTDTPVQKMKILIVEDDEVSHILLTKRLGNTQADLLHAYNGLEAVEACKSDPDIDLILMDIRMPVMNGHEATRSIREFNKEVIIIAQTAFALAGDKEVALESGCNDYITKPINREELLALIDQYLKK